jgi:hypothetical protein
MFIIIYLWDGHFQLQKSDFGNMSVLKKLRIDGINIGILIFMPVFEIFRGNSKNNKEG